MKLSVALLSTLIVILLLELVHIATADLDTLSMVVGSMDKRCIGQEMDQEDSAIFTVSAAKTVTSGSDHASIDAMRKDLNVMDRVIVDIIDPNSRVLKTENIMVNEEVSTIKMNIEERGVHQLCFKYMAFPNHPRDDGKATVSFNIQSQSRKIGNSASADSVGTVSSIEAKLKDSEAVLQTIVKEMDFSKRQETVIRKAGETTNTTIQWFSSSSIFVLVAASLWQGVYLRRFFISKKIL